MAQVRSDSASGRVVAVRAREPDRCGYAVRSGVRIYYEVFGNGSTTVLLLPPWAIVHSRMWKMQVPYLARHFRVITFDPRGNGRSDRPATPADYADTELVADAVAVLDAAGTEGAICVGFSKGAGVLLRLAVAHPSHVTGAVFVAPTLPLAEMRHWPLLQTFDVERSTYVGWQKYNAHYWRHDLAGFAEHFFGEVFIEPRSSKHIDDGVEWARQTDPETLIATARAPYLDDDPVTGLPVTLDLAAQVRCPSMVIYGDRDRIIARSAGSALAEALGCDVELFHGGGHGVQARHPVRFNLVLRRFAESVGQVQ
jgi:pimeloyl-ACP methyl ester carboxylesterase